MADSGLYFVRIDFGNGLEKVIAVQLQDGSGKVFSDHFGGQPRRLHGCSHDCERASDPEDGEHLNMKGFGKLFDLDLETATYGTNVNGQKGFFSPTRGNGDWEATDQPGPIDPKRKKHGKSQKKKNKKKDKNKKK